MKKGHTNLIYKKKSYVASRNKVYLCEQNKNEKKTQFFNHLVRCFVTLFRFRALKITNFAV